jgi:hypothetical protein
VIPNAAWRNADLPTRRPEGQLVQRPQVALDLHYLLSFYGNEEQLEPQRLLGSVARTLHARPVLTHQMIQETVTDPTFSFLANSNLTDQVELVKFTPLPLSLEELSKLWSVFFQIPYTLSVAYQGTVVLIESEETPQAALPMHARNIYVVPFRQPVIEQVMSQAGVDQPIVAGSTLIIRGRQLRGDAVRIRIGGIEVTPQEVNDTQISLPLSSLPAGSLRAGIQGVQVIHQMLMGTPPVPHRGVESNMAAFVLRPTITTINISNVQGSGSAPRSADMTVQIDPTIGRTQRVVLLLNEVSSVAPAAYTFVTSPRTTDTDTSRISVSNIRAADYFVRVQVDGAESPLDLDPASLTFGPKATIP